MRFEIGDKVTHIDYPEDTGRVVAKTSKYKGSPPSHPGRDRKDSVENNYNAARHSKR